MRYRTLTLPVTDLEGLLELALRGRDLMEVPPTPAQLSGLLRAELALTGEKLPGHAPGKAHRGPDLDLRRKA